VAHGMGAAAEAPLREKPARTVWLYEFGVYNDFKMTDWRYLHADLHRFYSYQIWRNELNFNILKGVSHYKVDGG